MASVFIVEDEPVVMQAFKRSLERFGHSVCGVASDGKEALDRIRALDDSPDLVLMDHRIPEMTGLETTKHLLKLDPQMCVIFVSADNTVRKDAMAAGARDFLEKPVFNEQLIASVENSCKKT